MDMCVLSMVFFILTRNKHAWSLIDMICGIIFMIDVIDDTLKEISR